MRRDVETYGPPQGWACIAHAVRNSVKAYLLASTGMDPRCVGSRSKEHRGRGIEEGLHSS
eukprot:4393667-Alexandrium_andersonii.AAC.1